MYTYQDLEKVNTGNDKALMDFTRAVINDHENSELYKTAVLAKEYDRRRNRTITNYRKFLYTQSGQTVPDNYSANYKMCSNFFDFFVTQENQYLLGNGVGWQEESTGEKLGDDFDSDLQELGKKALVEGTAFGFWNLDHLEVFGASEFAPLYDEENGALMAGVRFWQIDKTKPLRATLYEPDGYTEYIWDDKGGRVLNVKRKYILHIRTSEIDGTEIYDGENYPSFPIIPLWGSQKKQSELVGLQENIDAYDLIKSGFANDLDDASQIYWILQNAGGMSEADIAEFLNSIKRTHAASLEDGVVAEQHETNIPYAAREALLTRLRDDLFEQAMAFDPKKLASGGSVVTAVIKAAYAPLDSKTDEYEYCVRKFLKALLPLVGIEDENPTFTRSMIVNEQERIQTVLSAGQYLPQEYVTKKILTILGDGDQAEDILNEIEKEQMQAMTMMGQGDGQNPDEGEGDEGDEGDEGADGSSDGDSDDGEGEPNKKKKAAQNGSDGPRGASVKQGPVAQFRSQNT